MKTNDLGQVTTRNIDVRNNNLTPNKKKKIKGHAKFPNFLKLIYKNKEIKYKINTNVKCNNKVIK